MMKIQMKRLLLVCLLTFSVVASFAQRYARANGAWSGAIWASTPNGAAGSASVPTATDDVYTNGFQVTVGSSGATCRNLFISFNVSNSLTINNLATLTVTGTLNGWDDVNGFGELPVLSNVLVFLGSGSRMTFTGSNIQPAYDPYPIFFWDNTVPLGRVNFNLGSLSLNIIIPLSISQTLQIQSGTLTADPGASLSGNSTAALTISAGASMITNDALTNFNSITISGTLQTSGALTASGASGSMSVPSGGVVNSTGSSGPISANSIMIGGTITTSNALNISGTFQISSGGILNTSFAGSQGWWSTSAPSSLSLAANSTINYSGSSQNVASVSYGNLTLSGSGTKSVSGGGSVNVAGNLLFGNAGVSLTSANQLIFNGLAAQSISGGGTANFNGGLQINKTGTLTLSQSISVQNGLTITSGTFDLGSNTLNLSGNLVNNGTFTPANSTLTITGATSVSGSSSTSLNNLTIAGSGSLTAPSSLSISGNFSNSGSFNANNGTVTFNGSTPQSVTGTLTFQNINCNSTGGLSINGNVSLAGTLTLNSSGIFDADGSGAGVFTVLSTGVNTSGAIAALPSPANFSGDVTIQRFIHSQSGGDYRYLSMPITSGQNNLGRWRSAIGVTGNFSDPSTSAQFANIVDAGNTNPSVFTWNGTAYVAVGSGGSTSSTSVSSRTGYVAYNFNNGSTTASYRGQVETGNVPITISSTNGNYNLVPNPYPSAIDWDNVTKTNVADAIWLRTANNTFSSYIGGLAANAPFGGWTGEVATGQSFWTQSNGGGATLTFKEADKTTNTAQFLRADEPINYFRITLSSASQKDETVLRFNEAATDGLDYNFDALKRKNGNYVSALGANNYMNVSSYTSSPATDYAINTVPLINCSRSVKLKVADVSAGNYQIQFTDTDKMQLGYKLTFVDNFLQKNFSIAEDAKYAFAVTGDPASYGNDRFLIEIESPRVAGSAPSYAVSNVCGSQLQVSMQTQPGIRYQILKGGNVLGTIEGNGNRMSFGVDRTKLSEGVNALDVKASSLDGCNTNTFTAAINITMQNAPAPSVAGGDICATGSTTLTATGAPAGGSYRWYSSLTSTTPLDGQTTEKFLTPTLNQTTQYFVSTVTSQGCEGARTMVVARVVQVAKPAVTIDGFTLNSNASTGNQWFKDNVLIPGATSQQLKVFESGSYTVKVTDSQNGCSATSEKVVMSINAVDDSPQNLFSLYPNPVATDELVLYVPAELAPEISGVSIYDTQGRLGSTINLPSSKENELRLDVTDLAKGVYFVAVRWKNEFKFLRFIRK